jgi:TrpR-related protein YerC/YecD
MTIEEIPGLDELAAAFLTLRNADEAKRFLRDLCTRGELEALAHRWQIVRLLQEGIPYLEIAQRGAHQHRDRHPRGAVAAATARGGYELALDRTR